MVRRTRNRQLNSAGEQNSTSIDKTTPDHSDDEVHVMAAAQDHLGGVQDSLILQEIRNGNQALSSKLDAKTAEINQSISGLKVMLDTLNTCTTEAESRISTAEDQLVSLDSRVQKLSKENYFLLEKIDQLENYSRRNNIRVVNLKENCEGNDLVNFLASWIPATLGREHFTEPLIIERAHRALTHRPPADQRPRHVLIRLLKCQDRDKILQIAAQRSRKNNGPVMYEDKPVLFFPDLSASLMKRRKEFDQVKRELRSKDLPFALLHPATLRVTLPDGVRKFFKTPKEAAAFLRDSPEQT